MNTLQRSGAPHAIQTRYSGCKFRSRTEARWAVFFDACLVKWEYEVEGYDFSGEQHLGEDSYLRKYLPDFWLPDLKLWLEVKPTVPPNCFGMTEEESLMYYLVRWTDSKEGVVAFGPPDPSTPVSSIWRDRNSGMVEFPRRYPYGGIGNLPFYCGQEEVDAARSARFEFGESGRT